jgi:hypothetical protein
MKSSTTGNNLEVRVEVTDFKTPFDSLVEPPERKEYFSLRSVVRASIMAGFREPRSQLDRRTVAWRIAALKLALSTLDKAQGSTCIKHPSAWKHLDPSERGVLSFMLGNTVTKLLTERLLNIKMLGFVDLYRDDFGIAKSEGKSRPDFFGETANGWVAIESKGRQKRPSAAQHAAAKKQVLSLESVNGNAIAAHVVCWTYSAQDKISALFCDPEPSEEESGFPIVVTPGQLNLDNYGPIFALIGVEYQQGLKFISDIPEGLVAVPECDIRVGLSPHLRYAMETDFSRVASVLDDVEHLGSPDQLPASGPDGVIVELGQSWEI